MNSLEILFLFTAEMIRTKLRCNERVGQLVRIYKHNSENDREKKGNNNKNEVDMNNAEVENVLLMDTESVDVRS